jgi:hypothetical protein
VIPFSAAAAFAVNGTFEASQDIQADRLLLGQIGNSGVNAPARTNPSVSAFAVQSPTNLAGQPSSVWQIAGYTLPANALSTPGKGVKLTAFGGYTVSPNLRQMSANVQTLIGSTVVYTALVTSGQVTPSSGGWWYLDACFICQSTLSGQHYGGGMIVSTPVGQTPLPGSYYTATVVPTTQSMTFAITFSSAASTDVTCTGFAVDFLNYQSM